MARKYTLKLVCCLAIMTIVLSGISCGQKAKTATTTSTGAAVSTGQTGTPSPGSTTATSTQDDRAKVVQFMKGMQDAFNSFCYGIFAPGLQSTLAGADLEQKDAAIVIAIGINEKFQSQVGTLTPPAGFADLAALKADTLSANTEGHQLWVDFRTAVEGKNVDDMKTIGAKLTGFFSSPSMGRCFDETSTIMAKYNLTAEEIDYVPVAVLEKGPPEVP
jgi:hypothetical protein